MFCPFLFFLLYDEEYSARPYADKLCSFSLCCFYTFLQELLDDKTYTFHPFPHHLQKDRSHRQIEKKLKVFTAEGIYKYLVSLGLDEKKKKELQMEFHVDDHQYWPEDPKQDLHQEVENKWKNISEKTETDMETFSSEESQQAGDLIGQVQVENRDRYDYREFLRKFSVLREEVSVDPDSFDYIFYFMEKAFCFC